jgi:hypothetical protein
MAKTLQIVWFQIYQYYERKKLLSSLYECSEKKVRIFYVNFFIYFFLLKKIKIKFKKIKK